jgi:hypothetical protein
MSRARPLTSQRALRPLQIFFLLASAVLGLLVVTTRVRAQPAVGVGAHGPVPAGSGFRLVLASSASQMMAAAPSASAPALAASAASAASASSDSPIDYAEVQTEADFGKDLSEEQKRALGQGKVPIHREGPYKSPFAHPRFGGPATVKVGLVLDEVREYSVQSASFQATFFLSLTSDKPMPPLTLAFTNGREVNQQVLADTPTFRFYRCDGTFSSAIDLRSYPFDMQELIIEMEDLKAGVDQVVFEPDQNRTSLDEDFQINSWGVSSLGAHAYRHLYPSRFDRDDLYVSRYKFVLGVERFATSAAFSVFVPAFVIVLISLTGMWVPPDELEVRSAAGAPMLAAAVLFHYSLMQAIPATGYLTRADKLMLGVYISLFLNMLSTWSFLVVPDEDVDKAFRLGRAIIPPVTVLVMAAATFA